jgi:phosphate transport system protein
VLTTVLADDWAAGTTAAVHLTLLGRYYERFADHTVQVGRRTIFMATGTSPDHWPAQGDAAALSGSVAARGGPGANRCSR